MSDEDPFANLVVYESSDTNQSATVSDITDLHDLGDEVRVFVGDIGAKEHLSVRDYEFAKLVASGKSATSAYKSIYSTHVSNASAQVLASRRANDPKVKAAILKFRDQALISAQVTLDSLVATVVSAIKTAEVQQDTKAVFQGVDRLSGLMGIGKNQERKDAYVAALFLDADTVNRLEKEIATRVIEGDMIDITPREV